jgi:outer membrane protein insertion porin family
MLFSVYVYADTYTISNILIDGLQSAKPKSVLSVINLKKGKFYSDNKAKEDIRSIIETGYFDNVEVCFDNLNGNLTFTVKEKPYIEHIIFKGNSKFSERKLKDTSVLKERTYYDFSKLEESKEKISFLYGAEGYTDCQIEVYPTVDADTNKMTITFLITENNRIIIEGVKIKGAVFFKEEKILGLMETNQKGVFREDIYKTDLESIEKLYKNNGFMDYQFVSSTGEYNDPRTEMVLTLNISEGNRYKIGSITYNGNFAINNKEIEKITKLKKGQIFSQNKIDETEMGIYDLYSNKGYMKVRITSSFNKRNDGGFAFVDINLSIEENSVTYVRNIYIKGLVSIEDKLIRRELLIRPGDPLKLERIRRSLEKIHSLGFISNAGYSLLYAEDSNVVDLSFLVVEGENGMFSLGGGYSSLDGLIGSAQIQRLNIFGLGQKLSLVLNLGLKNWDYEIDWTEPWVFDKNLSLSLGAFNIHRRRDFGKEINAYQENRTGFMTKVGHRINDYLSLLFGYTYEHIIISDIKSSVEECINLSKDKTSSIFTQFIYDSRDYIFDPSRGSRHILNMVLAGSYFGGNVNFVKGLAKSTWFFTTFWKFVLCINLQGGIIAPYGHCSDVPFYEKFYLGGQDTIRGYKYRNEVGSKFGGRIMGIANIEYKFPIYIIKERVLIQGSIFYDIGGIWENYRDVNLTLGNDTNNLRSGIGFGIKFVNPIIPIRVDFGYGLNHKNGERLYQVHFSLGESIF